MSRKLIGRWTALVIALIATAAFLALARDERPPAAQEEPNVVVLAIDTLRVDHVGSYGYARPTTPNLDRFARAGVRFQNAYSVSSWTLPAVASLFTGLLPTRHGCYADGRLLDDDIITLARVLHEHDYMTAAMSANFTYVNPGITYPTPPLHLGQGFDTFQVLWDPATETDGEGGIVLGQLIRTVRADSLTRRMKDFLRDPREPFFLFALYIDPHYGYEPPGDYARLFAPPHSEAKVTGLMKDVSQLAKPLSAADVVFLQSRYDGEIRFVDEAIGDFLTELDESGAAEHTIVVIVADHGEAFLDHGRMLHGQTLYEETVRIPLMIRGPGIPRGVVVDEPVSIMDVMPTVLDLAGLPAPEHLDGVSVTSTWRDRWTGLARRLWGGEPPRELVLELDNDEDLLNGRREHTRALRRGRWKLIASLDGKQELYDLADDPHERENVASSNGTVAAELRAVLARSAPAPTNVPPSLGEAERERLRALGYLK
jgi:arylsulfatase A-like enzyme